MKLINATIKDVQAALDAFAKAAKEDNTLEAKSCKKLAGAANYLGLKDDVAKDLSQAYTHAEKKWALNFAKNLDACTKANELEKIKQYMCASTGYIRLNADPVTKPNVEIWLEEKFPAKADTTVEDKEA